MGYSEVWLDKKTVKVFYSDVGFSKPAKGRDLACYRAAEIALLKGFSRIIYLDVADNSKAGNGNDIPIFSNTRGSVITRMIDAEDSQWNSALDPQVIIDNIHKKYKIK